MADYEVLAPGGHENLINNVTERLDEKAYIDGYYAQLTAGAADSLTGRGDSVSASYLYRTTGGDADVADGTATVKSIRGRTVVWNQLVSTPYFSSDTTNAGTTATIASDNTVSISGTTETTGDNFYFLRPFSLVAGHKYLVSGIKKLTYTTGEAGGNAGVRIYDNTSTTTVGQTTETGGFICTAAQSTSNAMLYYYSTKAGVTPDVVAKPMVFDLTLIFGAGNEPSTVAEFEALFPEPYYPYDAGSLLPVRMTGIETVGFNAYDPTTGTAALLGGNAYQITGTYTALAYSTGETLTPDNDGIFTPTANGTLTVTGGNATDTCVHLVWSGYRDGEYEPYWKNERTIPAAMYFPQGIRSAGSVYDELTSDAAVTRVGAVDLGTLTWTYYSATGTFITNSLADRTYGTSGDGVSSKYGSAVLVDSSVEIGNVGDKTMMFYSSGTNVSIHVKDTAYGDDATAFTTAMSGVYLHYALATPTTVTIDPPLNLTYRVSDFGTERVMHTDPTAAPTQQVVYGLNVTDTVRRLPTEYISHDSFTQFRLALGAKLGVFIVETWDENDGRYEYTINDA